MYTLQTIKELYYVLISIDNESRGFDQYLRECFTRVYDVNLNFIGYEQK